MWRLVAVYFLIQVGFYGLNQRLPHLVTKAISGSYLLVGGGYRDPVRVRDRRDCG